MIVRINRLLEKIQVKHYHSFQCLDQGRSINARFMVYRNIAWSPLVLRQKIRESSNKASWPKATAYSAPVLSCRRWMGNMVGRFNRCLSSLRPISLRIQVRFFVLSTRLTWSRQVKDGS